jgi:hypothetical protein
MLSDNARKLADEAKRKRMWLYDPGYKKWYSPEDFIHIYTFVDAKQDFLNTLQIKHPAEGVQAGFKKLTDLQLRVQEFSKAVMEYYRR